MDKDDWVRHYRNLVFAAPKDVSLLDSTPKAISYTVEKNEEFSFDDGSEPSFPYLLTNGGEILFHTNLRPGSEYGAVIRTSGNMRWAAPADYPNYMTVLIRE